MDGSATGTSSLPFGIAKPLGDHRTGVLIDVVAVIGLDLQAGDELIALDGINVQRAPRREILDILRSLVSASSSRSFTITVRRNASAAVALPSLSAAMNLEAAQSDDQHPPASPITPQSVLAQPGDHESTPDEPPRAANLALSACPLFAVSLLIAVVIVTTLSFVDSHVSVMEQFVSWTWTVRQSAMSWDVVVHRIAGVSGRLMRAVTVELVTVGLTGSLPASAAAIITVLLLQALSWAGAASPVRRPLYVISLFALVGGAIALGVVRRGAGLTEALENLASIVQEATGQLRGARLLPAPFAAFDSIVIGTAITLCSFALLTLTSAASQIMP